MEELAKILKVKKIKHVFVEKNLSLFGDEKVMFYIEK